MILGVSFCAFSLSLNTICNFLCIVKNCVQYFFEGDHMHYKQKFVLFIDILGFKKYIDSTVNKEETDVLKTQSFYNLMKTLRHDLAMDYEKPESNWQIHKKNLFFKEAVITQFSDSIVISYEISKKNFKRLLQDANHIFLTGTYFGFIFRGAITKGDIIHENDIVFGPAFIKAYQMESDVAIFPRIVIDNELIDDYCDRNDKTIKNLVVQDEDMHFYLDIFAGLHERFQKHQSKEIRLKDINTIISAGLDDPSTSVRHKYLWLKEKYNNFKL